MSKKTPERLKRSEPVRVPVEEFAFKQNFSKGDISEIERFGARCLAKKLANASGFNSLSDVIRGAEGYGSERVFEDDRREQLVGCRGCGAMCTIVRSARKKDACPGTEDNPNVVISVAEAPQPNPWDQLGTFDDCRAGDVTVPPEAAALTQPVGLNEDQRFLHKLLSGHTD